MKIQQLQEQVRANMASNNNLEISQIESSCKQLLRINGTIDGKSAWILIDSGATENFISDKFVKQHRFPTQKSTPLPVQLADRHNKETNQVTQIKNLNFNSYRTSNLTAYVMTLQRYDMILGKPWLHDTNPVIDWQQNTLTFRVGRKLITETADNSQSNKNSECNSLYQPECNVLYISRNQLARADEEAEIYAVCINDNENETNETPSPEARRILKEFKDVFPVTLPNNLSPIRSLDHAIELIPGHWSNDKKSDKIAWLK